MSEPGHVLSDPPPPVLRLDAVSVAATAQDTTLSLSVAAGEIVALIGANGAGKSSLMRALAGFQPITAGRASLSGEDITRENVTARARRGIGYVPEGRRIFPGLTVAETLTASGPRNRRQRRQQSAFIYSLFPMLAARRHQRAWQLSGGQQQMLAIGRALMTAPKLLLMDEPTLGLAPQVIAEVLDASRQLATSGMAVLIAEQNAAPLLARADRAFLMAQGRFLASGPAASFIGDGPGQKALQSALMGTMSPDPGMSSSRSQAKD